MDFQGTILESRTWKHYYENQLPNFQEGARTSAAELKTRTIFIALLACSSLLVLVGPHGGEAQPLTSHAPFYIKSFAGIENFTSGDVVRSGSGTATDPFIISDWNITINDSTSAGIHIQNTHSFFIIRNVLIHRTGFIVNSQGIYLDNVQNGEIQNVNISNFYDGVWLSLGSATLVTTSNIWNNTYGVYMTGTNDIASANHLHNNTIYGAYVTGQYNTLTGNNASANGTFCQGSCQSDGAGIFAVNSNNIFENNILSDNTWFGIKLVAASNNQIIDNTVARDGIGAGIVLVDGSYRNLVMGNYVTEQLNAFGLENTANTTALQNSYNNITGNRITGNTQGIYLYNSPYNWIYDNYLNNTTNSVDNTLLNSWNITKRLGTNILGGPFTGGNLYSDYTGLDLDGDGFGDTPHSVSGGFYGQFAQDLLPLVLKQPGVIHDISLRRVSVQSISARVGASIIISVAVFNLGTVSESFFLSATYALQTLPQPQVISTVPVTNLAANTGKTITLPWNTAGLAAGTYFVQANASIVTGENNTANNACCTPPANVSLSINKPPVALFTTSNTSSLAGRPVIMNASQSYDPDGTIFSYSWNFGDGTSSTGKVVSHSWALAGNYTLTLTVTDNEGGASTNTTSLLVIYHQPGPPLTFQLTATSTQATLTWTEPSDNGGSPILKYRIYRGSSNSSFAWISNTTSTTYVDTTISTGQTYYYKVTAVNEAELESPITESVPQNVLIPSTPPGPPETPLVWIAILAGTIAVAVTAGAIIFQRRTKHRSPTTMTTERGTLKR